MSTDPLPHHELTRTRPGGLRDHNHTCTHPLPHPITTAPKKINVSDHKIITAL